MTQIIIDKNSDFRRKGGGKPTILLPMVHKHFFTAPDGGEVGVCAATVEACARQITGDGVGYTYTHSETMPYEHSLTAIGIAAALGGDWSATPQSDEHPSCNWYLQRADGLQLYVSGPAYSHREQFRIGLSAPRHNGYFVEAGESYPAIGCGVAKTPAQIAKDIERRLLTDAERVNGLVLARIANMQAADNKQLESWGAVHTALGKPTPARTPHNSSYWNGYFDGGSFEVHGGGTVTFKLHGLEPAQAVALAVAIKALNFK